MKTYSFLDLSGAFTHPLVDDFAFVGQIGFGQAVVKNTVDHTAHEVAADGTVQVTYVAGENGSVEITVQQTSDFHQYLLAWFNAVNQAAISGDILNWAAGAMLLQNTVDGSSHQLFGVSPSKNPDKTYAAQGGNVVWNLMAAQVVSQ